MVYCVQERLLGDIKMDHYLFNKLSIITPEEQEILDGRRDIDRDIYMNGQEHIINSKKLLAAGKLITIRPHTRFIHFPEHSHDYVEVIYMYSGETTHIVNGKNIKLKQGNLLFLNQSATHEVLQAGHQDIAVNFIVLPEFFTAPLSMIGEEPTPLRNFLVDCLCNQNSGAGYLYFDISNVKTIQNLLENLLWILIQETPNKRKISQMTMALVLMQLLSHTDALKSADPDDALVWQVLRYVEKNYINGSFAELTALLHYDPSWLSRQIKQRTGKTYTQLVQESRLAQAAYLLSNTQKNVSDIAIAVGYENISYFHRIFAEAYGKSPKQYRDGK